MSDFDHEYTDEITCPYCGYEMGDSWELDDSGSRECERCDREFIHERHTQITYSTKRKEP